MSLRQDGTLIRTRSSSSARRWLVRFGLLAFLALAGAISYGEYNNAAAVPFPTDSELRGSFSRAAAWIVEHRDSNLDDDSAMLWYFVREAGRLSTEPHLASLAEEYQSRHVNGTLWVWRFIFDPRGSELLQAYDLRLSDLPDYNRLSIYGATCNQSLREDPGVLALLDPHVCSARFIALRSPWCRTHQLMGLRFVQSNRCEPAAVTAETIGIVQNDILTELSWDFRVADAYIQKVLTLVESGRRKDVKAVWLRRILDAQRSDGGWDGIDIIARIPGNRVICWAGSPYPLLLSAPATNFHATAQGLYLMALLTSAGG
jgi:hypothetical protein